MPSTTDGQAHRPHRLAHHARLGLGDQEQRVEGGDQRIGLADRGLDLLAALRLLADPCELTTPSSRLRKRLSGVRRSCAMESVTVRMPFISRSVRSSMRLRFSDSRSISSLARRSRRQAAREIPRHDFETGAVDGIQAPRQKVSAHQPPAAETQEQHQRHRPRQRGGEQMRCVL